MSSIVVFHGWRCEKRIVACRPCALIWLFSCVKLHVIVQCPVLCKTSVTQVACKFPVVKKKMKKKRKKNKTRCLYTHPRTDKRSMFLTWSVVNARTFMKRIADLVCHVCITRHWFFCRDLALQPFILCFAVGPNGFEKFCYSPVTPEANVRIDFTCTGLHHLSRAWAVRAKAKWKAIHTKLLRQSHCSVPCCCYCSEKVKYCL